MSGRASEEAPIAAGGIRHRTRVRVRYGEVDRMGVVYHPNYLVYFEQGRTELLRALGGTYRRLEDEGSLLVVVETGVRHHGPAGYDELLEVTTHLASVERVRMRFEYEVARDGALLASGFTTLACTDRAGRPRRIPTALRERLDEALLGKPHATADVRRGGLPEDGP